MRPVIGERPLGAEQVDPLGPQFLVVEVRLEVVVHLHNGRLGGHVLEPLCAQGAGHYLTVPRVHEHDQALAALCRPADHEAVAKVWWAEAADNQAGSITVIGLRHSPSMIADRACPIGDGED